MLGAAGSARSAELHGDPVLGRALVGAPAVGTLSGDGGAARMHLRVVTPRGRVGLVPGPALPAAGFQGCPPLHLSLSQASRRRARAPTLPRGALSGSLLPRGLSPHCTFSECEFPSEPAPFVASWLPSSALSGSWVICVVAFVFRVVL